MIKILSIMFGLNPVSIILPLSFNVVRSYLQVLEFLFLPTFYSEIYLPKAIYLIKLLKLDSLILPLLYQVVLFEST